MSRENEVRTSVEEETHVIVDIAANTVDDGVAEDGHVHVNDGDDEAKPIDIRLADDFDRELLHRAVADAGRWAFGTVMVEVWVMNKSQTKLYRPKVGWWIDPVALASGQHLTIFTDPNHPGYLEAKPLSPGVGLPGILWTESVGEMNGRTTTTAFGKKMHNNRKVAWRDVVYLSKDPDQPPNIRLQGLADAGLGWAAGIPFDIGGKRGIVVYMCRSTIDLSTVKNPTNESYLISAADLIGSAWSLRSPRHKAIEERQKKRDAVLRRVKIKLLAVVRTKKIGTIYDTCEEVSDHPSPMMEGPEIVPAAAPEKPSQETQNGAIKFIKEKATQVITKTFHAGWGQMPPRKSFPDAIFNGLGALLTMLIITQLNIHMTETYSSEWTITVGPFSALAMSHYTLTSAPASQPLNCIVGQVVGITIAILIAYSDLELYLRQSFSCAASVFVMSLLGLIHPPAASTSVIFSSRALDWSEMLAFLMGYVIIIIVAALINNLSTKRQYPTYWGFEPVLEWYSHRDSAKEKQV